MSGKKEVPCTPEHKALIRRALSGLTRGYETRERMRIARTGKKHSAETKAKIRASVLARRAGR